MGLLNYGYALLLTHLLNVTAYSRFAAGQGLILWASTVAVVSVPWVLAQALARARSDAERNSATRFAKLAGAGSGIIAAAVVGIIATQVCGLSNGARAGLQHLHHLPGHHDQRLAAGPGAHACPLGPCRRGEPAEEQPPGSCWSWWPGWGRPGHLQRSGLAGSSCWRDGRARRAARIGRGSLRWPTETCGAAPSASPGHRGWCPCSSRSTWCWSRCCLGIAPWRRATRPARRCLGFRCYVAAAVATAFFPSLSRRATGGMIAARAVRMYAAVAVPVAVVLATVPAPILALVLPAQYSAVATLLRYTAVTGLAAGGISLVTAFFQAADDYSCLWWLGAGLVGYIGALLAGWRVDGITGLAVGGALGAAAALALAGYRLVRRQGRGVLARVPLVEPVVAAAVLVVLRPHLVAVAGGRISGGDIVCGAFCAARSPPRAGATLGRVWKPEDR